ncbi:hypothetical protein FJZ18_02070 [Candidatus Pacearchaeota archaeon]|nr:hypothetical protein [Candidatus Pacearchaeota archaeon]
MKIQDLFREDSKHISKWEENYTDEEFYAFNRAIRIKLDALLYGNKRLSPKELWMSAMVYHHGFTLSSSRKALRLAEQAYERSYKPAKTLIAQATDRLLQLEKKPQKFGTQVVKLRNGKLKMYKIDGTVTDKQRKEYGLPSLEKLKAYLN